MAFTKVLTKYKSASLHGSKIGPKVTPPKQAVSVLFANKAGDDEGNEYAPKPKAKQDKEKGKAKTKVHISIKGLLAAKPKFKE